MLKYVLLTVSIFIFFTPSLLADEQPSILVVGDSLSAGFGIPPQEGWVTLLQQRLTKLGYGHQVINASISGDTTRGALSRLPRALKLHSPKIVILELGGNDGLRGFPLKVMQENFEKMIELSQAAGAQVVLLGIRLPANYGVTYTQKFHDTYRILAIRFELLHVSWFLEGVALDPTLMQDDGFHPNVAAQPRLLDNVWKVLTPLL
ncbi:MAG: arylesterase [Gammaproteobacteria bacterium]